jgi:sulfite reductase (ferredoxin)
MSSVATPVKETKAQKAERLKREKNPWEHLDEIREFARQGFESIPPEWNMYFRWWGVYTQGDGHGVTGGTGGEGKAVPYLMARIKLANGQLFSHQLRTIADLTEEHARGIADITVRQNIQLHWVTIESLPEVFERLWRANMTTVGACGDVTRNITGCPLAGVDADELCDASPLAHQTVRMLYGNDEFYNLPRKYKISISGCRSWCNYPEINDIGLTAINRTVGGETETGFSVRVGGGLSTEPFLAARLDAFVKWNQVPVVVRGISEIFRDADVLRENRERARLKYLFLKHGWTAESFLSELNDRIGFKLDTGVEETPPDDQFRDHVGVHAQKQPGYSYVGASVLSGRITPQQMRAAADLADRFGSGEIRLTVMQNLVIVNIPNEQVASVVAGLEAAGLPVAGSPFWRGTIACTGTEFCKLAITETKGFSRWLVGQLDERLPGFEQQVKIHVTGCPNSCGQHWIADIGLEGKKVKVDGKMVDAFYFSLGGAVGLHQGFTRRTGYRCAAVEVPDAIERLMKQYQAGRQSGENLRAYFARHDEAQLRALLAGETPA